MRHPDFGEAGLGRSGFNRAGLNGGNAPWFTFDSEGPAVGIRLVWQYQLACFVGAQGACLRQDKVFLGMRKL